MFTESLLESSNVARKHSDKRWPMTLAFVLESIAVSFLLLLPLSVHRSDSGIGTCSADCARTFRGRLSSVRTSNSAGQRGTTAPTTQIVNVITNRNPLLRFGHSHPTG